MARKAHVSRAANKAKREAALLLSVHPEITSTQADPYVSDQLVRARAHISRINEMMDKETDAQQLERLARALNVVSERERVLAGRPLPGNLRPMKEMKRRPPSLVIQPV